MRNALVAAVASLMLLGGFGATRFAHAAEACFDGKFAGTATPPGQQGVPVLASIVCREGKIGGSVQSPLGLVTITGGSTSSDAIHIETAEGVTLDLKRDGESWRGSFKAGDNQGSLDMKRDDTATYAALSAEPIEHTDLTPAQWREDLRFVAVQIPKEHKNAFHRISAAQWSSSVETLDRRLDTLPSIEVAPAVASLVAQVGDGHTAIRLPAGGRRLPVWMFWFGDELRVVRTTPAYAKLLGARVIAINGTPAQEAAKRVDQEIANENRWGYLAASPYLLRHEDVLLWTGLVAPDAAVRMTLKLANGTTETDRIDFATIDAKTVTLWVGGQPPIQQRRPDEGLWWEFAPQAGTLYANFREYDQLAARTAALMKAVDERRPAKLVIDMRDNGGGDFDLFRQTLLKAIVKRPWLNHHGRLYVIIGREMFSAAMTNAADFESKTNAIVVGEPIGERPNSYQEVRFSYLPNSHLRLGVSTQFYTTVPGDPEAVFPTISKPPTWRAFSRGKDDPLDWIEAQP